MADTSELQLRLWFGYLTSFKTCAEKFNTDVVNLSLLDFANAKPATYLADAVTQSSFANCAVNETQIPVQTADVSSASSFVVLLGSTFGLVNRYIAAYLRFLSPAPFNKMNVGDFELQMTPALFPKGASDPLWLTMNADIAAIVDKTCYSAAQQTAVAALVNNNAKLMSDVVTQIAKLG